MVKLEKLELIGFKSFLSRTEFLLDRGITAVVGPNGCGKSNIGDALNWVIGEQSARTLRGDRMEDVIFNGSEGRRPTGMAEVSLHLKNGAGEGVEETVVLTRRLFRSGESEYLLNGERARLRDIQETLTRINIGSGLYAIIEQGKVDAALSSRPRERRVLIEEAAGIALYRARRRQAEAKLEATEANLLRVNDIITEIERLVGSLKRQAARARRYGRTVEAITRLERIVLFHDHARLDLARLDSQHEEERLLLEGMGETWRRRRDELHALDRALDQHERDLALGRQQEAESEAAASAARERAEGLAARLEEAAGLSVARAEARRQAESQLAAQGSECRRLDAARGELHEGVAHREAALEAARSDLLRLVDSLGDARNHRRQAEEERERAGRRAGLLHTEVDGAREEAALAVRADEARQAELVETERAASALEADLEATRAETARLQEALEREEARREEAARRLHGHEARLKAIEEVDAAGSATREALARAAARIEGPPPAWAAGAAMLADGLQVPERLEAAAEIYLRDLLDAAMVADRGAALEGLATLKRSDGGRASFLIAPAGVQEEAPKLGLSEDVRSDPGFVGRLSDLLEADDARRRALAAATARAVVVTDLEAAARLRPLAPFLDLVTLDGDVLHAGGLIEGGARPAEGAGVLGRRRLRQELATAIAAGRSHVASLDGLIDGLSADRARALAAAAALQEQVMSRGKEAVALRHRALAAAEAAERARSKLATLERERVMAEEEHSSLGLDLERLGAVLAELEEARGRRDAEIASLQEEMAALRAALSEGAEALASARAALSALGERVEAIDGELARLRETQEDLRARVARETEEQGILARRREDAQRRQEAAARALEEMGAGRLSLQEEVSRGETDLEERRRQWERRGADVRAARGALEEARARREQVSLEKERASADLRHLVAAALEGAPEVGLEELLAALGEEDRTRDPEAVRAELLELRRRRDGMGPVNMMALDQFRELEERLAFLTTQRKDLQEAIASLRETIARINRTSRERFMEAFERIRTGFNEIFRSLFRGGRADLRLMTENGDEDVLECGLEIIAQPPGKRLQSVSLLSGGEKALTAIALVFAIFKYRPSPFCLLDEVDAALDEANVLRFSELLKSMTSETQFVLITHSRATMEVADLLYGITMEEPGVSSTISVVMEGEADRSEAVRTLPAQLAARHKGGDRRRPLAAGVGAAAGSARPEALATDAAGDAPR